MMQVWVIDDEEYMRSRVVPPMVLARWPDAQITTFDALATAIYKERSVDLIIIDITSVCPVERAKLAYGPMCQLLEKHPGATMIINSALPRYVTDVVRESILEYMPEAKVLISPFPFQTNLPRVLSEVV